MSNKLETPVLNTTPVTSTTNEVVQGNERVQAPNGTRSEAVFANQLTSLNRRNEKDPHFFGSVKIDGLWYQTATWINVVNNVQNLSTAYTLMTVEQAEKAEIREAEFQKQRQARANPLTAPPVNPLAEAGEEEPEETKGKEL